MKKHYSRHEESSKHHKEEIRKEVFTIISVETAALSENGFERRD